MKNKFNNFIHNKTFTVILILLLMSVVSITGTYAWFTWSSTENTSLTMTIGKFADVMFSSGNAITTELTPVFNYYDGEKTTFSINNRDTSGTSIKYIVKLNITTIPTELRSESVKYSLVKDGELVTTGDLSTAYDNYSINVYSDVALSGITHYTFYLYIDSNIENDSSMMNKTIVGSLTVEAMEPTSYNDFTYYLGSENATVATLENYYDNVSATYYDISFVPIELESNEILLFKYNGESKDVYVPNTYTIDDVTYDVVLASAIYIYSENRDFKTYSGAFYCNSYIESVFFGDDVKLISGISEDKLIINSAFCMFEYCISLINVPELPNSVTDMTFTFFECPNLVNAPEIPSTVTNMEYTFWSCTSLVNSPEIPNSVTNMNSTFELCTSLVFVPEIPNSVTYMNDTFSECTSLTGIVKINSNNVTSARDTFFGITNPIMVEVPSGSTTYTTISQSELPSNVILKTFDAS